MEKLLTKQDIKEILSNIQNSPVFRYYGVRLMPLDKYSFKEVIAVSDKNSLLLIKGNEDTGNQHITERHNFWSTNSYVIKNNEGESVFQNQSRFPKGVPPFDFLKIADEIYSKDNLIENNPHPMADKFDLYIGEYLFDKPKKEKVKLLLYKQTKIIHSLFLVSSSYNRKKVKKFPFSRGKVEIKWNSEKKIKETFIPYIDIDSNLRYGILLEKYPEKELEHILILIFTPGEDGFFHRKLAERKLVKFKSEKSEEVTYQYCDLREVERYIMELNNDLESGNLKLEK